MSKITIEVEKNDALDMLEYLKREKRSLERSLSKEFADYYMEKSGKTIPEGILKRIREDLHAVRIFIEEINTKIEHEGS